MTGTMEVGISREDALQLLKKYLKNDKLIAHCLASEAIMRELARELGQDTEKWGIAGLLHDMDYEMTAEDPGRHGREAAAMLMAEGVNADVVQAIERHNAEGLGLTRSTIFDHALTCAESITGLIVATALVYPDKKIASVKPKSVTKRMKTPHFARAVSRERILECEKLDMPLNDFVALSLKAMTEIAEELGL